MATIADSAEWKALEAHAAEVKKQHLRTLVEDAARTASLQCSDNGFILDYSRQNATVETKELLLALAKVSNLEAKKAAMFQGTAINSTEGRSVLHCALRAPKTAPIVVDGVDQVAEVHKVLDSIQAFSDRVRSGGFVGVTGKPLTTVVAVGIGGSYLGPEFLFEALKCDSEASQNARGRTLKFLANVDPVDFKRATEGLDAESTLVVIVSKTFTTAETMLNARTMRKWLLDNIKGDKEAICRQHIVACSSALQKTGEFGIDPANVFGFWDWVGGRFSIHSAVGMVPLALHYGFGTMRKFLDGARAMDEHFISAPLESNLPVMLGLFGLWNSSFLGHAARAVLPYSQALLRFPAHLQQVDMESNGKGVNLAGARLPFETGEIVFGEPGTNGQHSFYQLMHQGRVIPAEFIGVCKSQNPVKLEGEEVSSHDELMSNFFAQPDALAMGKTQEECAAEGIPEALQTHMMFTGNRPSMSLLIPSHEPYELGRLLALYEHRVAVQGFVWDINSFDQWGVQLGKVLAKTVRDQLVASRQTSAPVSKTFNPSTSALMSHYIATSE